MNNSAIRAFGIALFLVGALLALAVRFDLNIGLPTKASNNTENVEKLQKKLDQANKEIALLKEQVKQSPKENTQNTEAPKTTTKDKHESASQGNVTMTLQIYGGMEPYTVAQKLEDGGVIENSVEMELLLANPKYARSLQIGAYDVNSSMSLEEIAKLITGKKQ
ncbi:hypothetical protein ABE61_08295 [Lysinibacillus sphaericus]|uniref:hypothetical protein n=1 Tax=Lysinibacillus sphaericus TaxID=1421 RepID=UPI0018CCFA80|nr:hypothetical protein [Lysinibacillus sphaericus]MBG9454069.1 hypothetical protein [Lysinibacillus sphaericus]MBG9477382.1 hypothetical protein [Lysinibacillus sphaericus]MBG9593564.1 hypothetical protein [Lysinibacillus sphaericus]